MILISYHDKCTVKVGTPGNHLALVPKSKEGWITTSVKVKYADHETFIKSKGVPSAIFIIDIPND